MFVALYALIPCWCGGEEGSHSLDGRLTSLITWLLQLHSACLEVDLAQLIKLGSKSEMSVCGAK